MKKKVLTISCIVLLALIGTLTGGSLYMLNYSLRPENRGKDLQGSMEYMMQNYPQLKPWVDSLQQHHALKDTFITAPDGIRMHAYYAYASRPSRRTAVIVHGYTDNAIRIFQIGYLYNHSLDYNVHIPDLRYSGLSEGEDFQMGWLDRKDVIQWIDTAPALFGDSLQMVVHGISMGAATTMMVSGEAQQPFVKCFVEDCGYTNVWDEFSFQLKDMFGPPEFPLMYTTSWLCNAKYGWNFQEASSLEQVKKCSLPMFFIHGDADTYVPTRMVYPLYEAKSEPKELWIVPGATHAMSYKDYPQEYTERVKKFVGKYIR